MRSRSMNVGQIYRPRFSISELLARLAFGRPSLVVRWRLGKHSTLSIPSYRPYGRGRAVVYLVKESAKCDDAPPTDGCSNKVFIRKRS